ncbi:iron-regulated protein [Flavobacterium akiainvivens]|uniref:Iron-regulated protein n=1 Tax=Flavobacterium akiainvivens TaxID=1202724 RepID=A0A0M8ME48_9FLAO|nr:ChaN family lipoprotein [Flavobacterium akiainvivens]KOS06964.1 iron-regulated protein [Flavobacterium akiainvivens]SFQ59936.1 Uncharacterized iron-regulated protein [Flavobacterium akiainvivens]
MKLRTLFAALIITVTATAQDKQGYQLFTKEGKKTTYKKLLKAAGETEVVLFGELHDDAMVHWLQLELTKDLGANHNLVLGAEMIEADNQDELNQYLAGTINQKQFDSVARLWPNYKTDYKPLVDFAKDKKFKFVAANIPRRYASLVYKQGFEALNSLTAEEKTWIAPLPIAYDASLPGYQEMLKMGGGHGGDNLPKAQAVKDATMGYFIAQNLTPNTIFVHYNGTYHSDNFEGINWYLKKQTPNVKILTIAAISQKELDKLEDENLKKADFILVVDEDMTKTH